MIRNVCIGVLLILMSSNLSAQSFVDLSGPEKLWVISHPFSALKAKKLSLRARHLSDSIAKVSNWSKQYTGGKKDAIRHFIWMALISSRIGPKRAKSLGDAHERGNKKFFFKGKLEDGDTPDLAAMNMDLWNNAEGIKLGSRENLTDEQIVNIALLSLQNGILRMIKQDSQGNFLDEHGKIILDNEWKGLWKNPRCLMPSIN